MDALRHSKLGNEHNYHHNLSNGRSDRQFAQEVHTFDHQCRCLSVLTVSDTPHVLVVTTCTGNYHMYKYLPHVLVVTTSTGNYHTTYSTTLTAWPKGCHLETGLPTEGVEHTFLHL